MIEIGSLRTVSCLSLVFLRWQRRLRNSFIEASSKAAYAYKYQYECRHDDWNTITVGRTHTARTV